MSCKAGFWRTFQTPAGFAEPAGRQSRSGCSASFLRDKNGRLVFLDEKKKRGIVSPPVAFCRRFFRKVHRLEPTGGPNPFRSAFTIGRGPAPVSGDPRIRPFYQSVLFSSTVLPFARLLTNRYPKSYQGFCARGVCDDLIAWLSLPAPLAPLVCCQGSQASRPQRSVGVPSASPVTDPYPHMQSKSCDQSLYVLSLYDRVQPVVYGSAKNEQCDRDQVGAACQKNMASNVFLVLLIVLVKMIIKSTDKESEYYLQCVRQEHIFNF